MLSASQPYAFVRRLDELIQHIVVELDQLCFHRKVRLSNYVFCIKLFPPVYEDARPEIDEEWPAAIKCLLESGFDKDINLRPKASLFDDIIRDELKKLRNGDTQTLNDSWILRRRSLWSFTKMELPPEKKIMLMREAEEEDESPQLITDQTLASLSPTRV